MTQSLLNELEPFMIPKKPYFLSRPPGVSADRYREHWHGDRWTTIELRAKRERREAEEAEARRQEQNWLDHFAFEYEEPEPTHSTFEDWKNMTESERADIERRHPPLDEHGKKIVVVSNDDIT
jgi:hypothetical protein